MKTCPSCNGRKTTHNPSTHDDTPCRKCNGKGEIPVPILVEPISVRKPEDAPQGPHWAFLEFDQVNRDDGYGGNGLELDLSYEAFFTEEGLKTHLERYLNNSLRTPAPYLILRVEGKAIVSRSISLTIQG